MPPDVSVVHDPAARRFHLDLGGQAAVADYDALPDGTWVFTHTFVPPALRGRGAAGRVVRAALEAAREGNHRVVPRCPYVADYVSRHHEYADLLAT